MKSTLTDSVGRRDDRTISNGGDEGYQPSQRAYFADMDAESYLWAWTKITDHDISMLPLSSRTGDWRSASWPYTF